MVVALAEQGVFTLDEFREQLIAAIDRWERAHDPDEPYSYYHRWQEALEAILADHPLVGRGALRSRTDEFARRPHGHDHDH